MSIRDYFLARQREIERKERLDTATKVGFGLAVGALVGSAAGILFAPKSGKETREDIKNFAEQTADQIKKTTKEVGENVQQTYHNTLSKIANYGDEKLTELKNVSEDIKDAVEDKADEVSKKVNEVKKDAAKTVKKTADKVSEKAEKEGEKAEAKSK